MMDDDSKQVLPGLIAVEAALVAGQRDVGRLCVAEAIDHRKAEPLRRLAKGLGHELHRVPRVEIDEMVGDDKHGGVAGLFGPKRFVGLDELLAGREAVPPLLAMLDGIEDPYNFAHAVRALWASGCTGLVVRPRNWFDAGPLVARASGGATELIPTAITEAPSDAVAFFKANGLVTVATSDTREAVPMHEADLARPMLLLIGGENRGIKRSVLNEVDVTVRIPYGRAYDLSLGTVAATAAVAFEALRQRRADAKI